MKKKLGSIDQSGNIFI